jgi:hypothetical protein
MIHFFRLCRIGHFLQDVLFYLEHLTVLNCAARVTLRGRSDDGHHTRAELKHLQLAMMNVEDDSMKNMVRICRLTLAPIPALGNDVQITKDAEAEWILDKEKMARGMEIAMPTTSTSSHRILGVEDRLSYRFWARDGEEDSDEDSEGGQEQDEDDSSMQTLNSPEFCWVAMEVGFTESELLQAEEEVKISPNSKKYIALEGSLASRVIKDIISNKKVKPWSGPLPPPRISPRRTIGDAIAMAHVRTNPQNRQFIPDSFKQ